MLFNSIEFIIFFPVVAVIFYLLPRKWRWAWLLASSCWFYVTSIPWFIIPLFSLILVEYITAIYIERWRKDNSIKSRLLLIIGIIFPLIFLFLFKYMSFFNTAAGEVARIFHLNYPRIIVNLIIPLGISYYTLHHISYVIEVYRGAQRAERHFGIYTLYISFFAKIIAGPIERPNLLQQFHEMHDPEYREITDGLRLMIFGFFKKLVIADRVGIVVNEVYDHLNYYHGIYYIVATILFAVQVYCDFSGYSDIAQGSAKVLGIRLMDNFNRPYGASSILEFWRRWHISLTSWLRDYCYIPLGGNRVVKWRWYYNLFITFFVSGIWHGASWNFIGWGVLHGLYVLFGLWSRNIRSKLIRLIGLDKWPRFHKGIQVSVTCILVCFAWIFFSGGILL